MRKPHEWLTRDVCKDEAGPFGASLESQEPALHDHKPHLDPADPDVVAPFIQFLQFELLQGDQVAHCDTHGAKILQDSQAYWLLKRDHIFCYRF